MGIRDRFAVSFAVLISDVAALSTALLLAYIVRSYVIQPLFPNLPHTLPFGYFVQRWYFIVVWAFVFAASGLYGRRIPFWEELRRLWTYSTFAAALSLALILFSKPYVLSRLILGLAWFFGLALFPVFRAGTRRLLSAVKLYSREVALVTPDDERAEELAGLIESERAAGYRVGVRYSSLAELPPKLKGPVFVDMPALEDSTGLQRLLEGRATQVYVLPELYELIASSVRLEELAGAVVLRYEAGLLKPENLLLKRVIDVVGGGLLLLVSLPLFLLLSLLVRLTGRGVIYRQTRVGRAGRDFVCLKFRTMHNDGDARLKRYFRAEPDEKVRYRKGLALKRDPRVTGVGRLLRRFSLDELPQLWHVFTGQMSLVGPRPYLREELERLHADTSVILRVKPGLTGFYQVSGRKSLGFTERMLLDEYYVRRWSLWTDVELLLKTFRAVFAGKGAQ